MRSAAARMLIRAVALAFLVVAVRQLVWMPWYANEVLADVEVRSRAALASGDPARTAILARQNIARLQEIAGAVRDDADYYMLYAANASMVGDYELAVQLYTAALANADHRPEIYYERGIAYLQLGKIEASVADLSHAARFNPYIIDSLSGELRDRVKAAAGIR